MRDVSSTYGRAIYLYLIGVVSIILLMLMIADSSNSSASANSSSLRKTTVVTSNVSSCTDCSLSEGREPNRMYFALRSVGLVKIYGLDWSHWGTGKAIGRGKGRIETNGYEYGRVRVTLTKPRAHYPDGCGNRGNGRIYTRARMAFGGFASQKRSVTISLPRTGCETY